MKRPPRSWLRWAPSTSDPRRRWAVQDRPLPFERSRARVTRSNAYPERRTPAANGSRRAFVFKKGWRRRTLPQSLLCSTIRAARLNGRVRDGNGCVPRAKATNHICRVQRVGVRYIMPPMVSGVCSLVLLVLRHSVFLLRIIRWRGRRTAVKPHGQLVRLGYTCCHASTCRLST